MKAKVPIRAEIGLEENSSNRIKENTKESDFRQLNLVLDSLEIITSLQGARILFFSLFSYKIRKQLNNRGLKVKSLKHITSSLLTFFQQTEYHIIISQTTKHQYVLWLVLLYLLIHKNH